MTCSFASTVKQMELIVKTHTPSSPYVIVAHLLRPTGMTTVAVDPHVPSQVKTWLNLFPTVTK